MVAVTASPCRVDPGPEKKIILGSLSSAGVAWGGLSSFDVPALHVLRAGCLLLDSANHLRAPCHHHHHPSPSCRFTSVDTPTPVATSSRENHGGVLGPPEAGHRHRHLLPGVGAGRPGLETLQQGVPQASGPRHLSTSLNASRAWYDDDIRHSVNKNLSS